MTVLIFFWSCNKVTYSRAQLQIQKDLSNRGSINVMELKKNLYILYISFWHKEAKSTYPLLGKKNAKFHGKLAINCLVYELDNLAWFE